MKNRYYLIINPDYKTVELDRIKVLIELDDYVGFTYINSRFEDDFGRISYVEKSKLKDLIVKDLGTNPEWSPDELDDDSARSIS